MTFSPRALRAITTTVVALTTVAVLAGCFPTVRIAGPAATPAAPTSVDDFYAQTLTWAPCNDEFECTTVATPIDWEDPAAGATSLAVVRHRATGTALGSLLTNPGGPGASGWDAIAYGLDYMVSPVLIENFDVIGWDPRGVGQSSPVTCYTDPADIDEALYGTFASPYGTQGWIDELTVDVQDFASACEQNTGPLLGHIDSVSTAHDMDLMRALLGDETLNYLGYSYGTLLGTVYAELFPENVGRLVLDGAVDPTLSDFDSLLVQMAGFDSALAAYMDYCLAGTDCPFTGPADAALAQVRELAASVDGLGLVNADGRVLDSATVGTGVASALYSEDSWPDLSALFAALQVGDPTATFEYADYYNSRNSDGTYSGNSVETYTAVTCLDGDFVDDPATTLERLAEIDAAAPILGRFFAYDDYAALDTACTNWPFPAAELPESFDAAGAAPILVIGTTNDPATPYAWSVSLADQLSSGVLITHEGEGHTVYNQGVTCIDSTVDDYFVRGVVPASDPLC